MNRLKSIPLTAIIIATSLTFFSCSSDDGDETGADSSSSVTNAGAGSSSSVGAGGGSSSGVGGRSSSSSGSSGSGLPIIEPCPNAVTGSNTVTCGGQTYRTVKIGTQTWMAENLNYDVEGSSCYDDDPANCETYGRLYYWKTAMNNAASSEDVPSGIQGVCPSGWHLPSLGEWRELTRAVGGTGSSGFLGAATPLKAVTWNGDGDVDDGTDAFGFSALPGGGQIIGINTGIGTYGIWWGSTSLSDMALFWEIRNDNDVRREPELIGGYQLSVRCVKDPESSSNSNRSSSSEERQSCETAAYDSSTEFCDARDGKKYKFVTIGTQTWMAENLNYKAEGSKCVREYADVGTLVDNGSGCNIYGRLYDWTTAVNNSASSTASPSGVQGVCPSGWHLPSNAEWTTLTNYVGLLNAGKLLATSWWQIDNGTDTDEYGFSAIPGGKGIAGRFDLVYGMGFWWSSVENSAKAAHYWAFFNLGIASVSSSFDKTHFHSVRCLKD